MVVQVDTKSILFSDVKGYSQLKSAEIKIFFDKFIPDLTKEVIDKYRETFIDINTWGDGLIIVGQDPYKLARTALLLRDYYHNYDWDDYNLKPLTVRISLHHGAIYKGHDPIRQRDGVIGTEVTLGARLEPVVTPGEIWCTEIFRGLIKKDVDSHLEFDDIGEKELAKDYGLVQTYKLRRETDPK
jgi:hypothetical protein